MGMIPYDVRSTVSRYSSCSEHSTTIHAFRSATNEGISSRPMNDIRVLNLKRTKMTYFPKNRVLQKKSVVVDVVFLTLKTVLTSIQYLLFITLQGKETNFRGHKLTRNKVQKKIK